VRKGGRRRWAQIGGGSAGRRRAGGAWALGGQGGDRGPRTESGVFAAGRGRREETEARRCGLLWRCSI